MTESGKGKFIATTPAAIQVDNSKLKGDAIDFDMDAPSGEVAAVAEDGRRQPDAIDRLIDGAIGELGGLDDQLLAGFEDLIAAASSWEEVRELVAIRAGDVLATIGTGPLAEMLERAGFAAHIAGLVEAPGQ